MAVRVAGTGFAPWHGDGRVRPKRFIREKARDQLGMQGVAGFVCFDVRQ